MGRNVSNGKAAKRSAKARPGRPTKYTPARVRKICRAIADGMPIEFAAAEAGISASTFHEWQKAFPEFSESIETAKASGVHTMLRRMHRWSRHSYKATAWYLEHVHPQHFARNRIEHEHRGEVTVKSEMDLSKLSTDELRTYRDILRKGRAAEAQPTLHERRF